MTDPRPLNVCIISPVFPPEPVVSARTSYDISEALQAEGHRVTILTAYPNRPEGAIYKGYRRRWFPMKEDAGGLSTIRCFSFLSPKSTMFSRLLENFSFGLSSAFALARLRHVDVIYSNSWPVVASGMAMVIARLRSIPVVLSVQDVYPESLESQGRLHKDQILYKTLKAADGWIARAAAHVVVISNRMASIYRGRGVKTSCITMIPNWLPSRAVDVTVQGTDLRNAKGIAREATLFVYAGNVGKAAGVDSLIRAFARLPHDAAVNLLIAGAGSELDACKTLAAEVDNGRIHVLSPWPSGMHSEVLRAADFLLLPTQGTQSLASVPSKLISYMLAGRPVLAIALTSSDTAAVIEASDCGWVIPPGDEALLAAKLEQLTTLSQNQREHHGQSGRRRALASMTSDTCIPQILDTIRRVGNCSDSRITGATHK